MSTVETAEVYFDPYDVDINADPYPTYARLREEAPAYYNERYDFWALSRHADVEQALLNWQVFTSTRSDILDIMKADVVLPPGVIMFEDPPVHTAQRGLMARVFTPRRMAELEDQVRRYCVACLDPLIGSEGFDVITELASTLPMRVIGMLLGIPEQDQVAVRDKTDANLRTVPGKPMAVQQENVASGAMFEEYIEWRSKHPSDDLMTTLLNAEFEDEHGETRKLTRQEVLTYTSVLAGAGNETTGRLIGWLTKVLADHPDQRRQVVEDRSLIPRVIDETLRFEPTGHSTARWVTEDIEVAGTTIPAGHPILLISASANRDPRRYTDPDVFDIHRTDIHHLTFGFGLHFCLGASLARLEGRVALDELLNRFPEWDVDYDGMKLAPTSTVRGWERMPISLPARSACRRTRGERLGTRDGPAAAAP
ncbi:MAG TPA: cytochrome P450 [Microthrixaceae bacterium]|nr:cytochrome P450 [Microthrixaceae bacterium]